MVACAIAQDFQNNLPAECPGEWFIVAFAVLLKEVPHSGQTQVFWYSVAEPFQSGQNRRFNTQRGSKTQLEKVHREPAWRTVIVLCNALDVTADAFLQEPSARPDAKKWEKNGVRTGVADGRTGRRWIAQVRPLS